MNYKEPGLSSLLEGMVELRLSDKGFVKENPIAVSNRVHASLTDHTAYRTIWIRMANLFVTNMLAKLTPDHTYQSREEFFAARDRKAGQIIHDSNSWLISDNMSVWVLDQMLYAPGEFFKNVRTTPDQRVMGKTLAIVGPGKIPLTYHAVKEVEEDGTSNYYVQMKFDLTGFDVFCWECDDHIFGRN